MFSPLGLFQGVKCPDSNCKRPQCVFSHRSDLPPLPPLIPPVAAVQAPPPPTASTTRICNASPRPASVPVKRPVAGTPPRVGASSSPAPEPPRKLQKLGPQRSIAVPTQTQTASGVPVLRVNAAQSLVAVPVRQAMLKNLYEHFVGLYEYILPSNPTLASEHSLRQEEEVYKKTNKYSYRNAIITSIAALKRRPVPDSASHPSIGTEGDVATREAQRDSLANLQLTQEYLEPLIMSRESMKEWGYMLDIPPVPGGHTPSQEHLVRTCDRCAQPFVVKKMDEAAQCSYHWGRPYNRMVNGEKTRLYNCCLRPQATAEGCVSGPHVFYEKEVDALHSRHSFSHLQSGDAAADTALEAVALDCEMIYTTGGMRVARVSVVDGTGKEIFDEMVRMDEGVEIIDYNTRFSGITAEEYTAKAVLPLASIRRSLDAFICADTILIGHALDNDLKTLRIVHDRCVDTAILFPHRGGPPYRRSLRDLVKEHLGKTIQAGGGTTGHSSVEDSIATLDLVRWYVLNRSRPKVNGSGTPAKASTPTVNGEANVAALLDF